MDRSSPDEHRLACHRGSDWDNLVTGIGGLGASALTAGVGDFGQFKAAHQLGAWLGLVPSQNSSGGKTSLGRITKRGDDYLRTLLIQGAKAAVMSAGKRNDPISRWLVQLVAWVGWQKACVAMANVGTMQVSTPDGEIEINAVMSIGDRLPSGRRIGLCNR